MKKTTIIVIIVLIIIALLIGVYFITKAVGVNPITNVFTEVPDGYIAVFNGGVGEKTYSTYIYKIDNGHDNMGFKYVNTENTTKSYGSSQWDVKITGSGEVTWTDGVFEVAERNHAYSYVLYNDKVYSISEFQGMFLMD